MNVCVIVEIKKKSIPGGMPTLKIKNKKNKIKNKENKELPPAGFEPDPLSVKQR